MIVMMIITVITQIAHQELQWNLLMLKQDQLPWYFLLQEVSSETSRQPMLVIVASYIFSLFPA